MLEVSTTVSSRKEAQKIASALVEEKLVACVWFWKISSIYKWREKTKTGTEWVLVCKTKPALNHKVRKKIEQLHPFELPVITFVRVGCSTEVERWVYSCTK